MMYPIEELPDWQLGYIAGIIDGEGTINLRVHKGRPSFDYQICVGMADEKCIRVLAHATELGTVRCETRLGIHSDIYRWVVADRISLYVLLKAIRPYLVVKKKHADVMLEYIERRLCGRSFTSRDTALYDELTFLNKKGKKVEAK